MDSERVFEGGVGLEPTYKHVIEAMEYVHELPDGSGTTVCPRCGGTLHYEKRTLSSGSSREWSRGQCETDGCISWLA